MARSSAKRLLDSPRIFDEMEMFLGMAASDTLGFGTTYRGSHGAAMKSTSGWSNNGNGSNSSGMNILPAGNFFQGFQNLGTTSVFWSTTQTNSLRAIRRTFKNIQSGVERIDDNKTNYFSCRCVKDKN